MKLIYRGEIFEYRLWQSQPIYKPRALNWRYQVPGFVLRQNDVSGSITHSPSPKSHAMNWRYQLISQSA